MIHSSTGVRCAWWLVAGVLLLGGCVTQGPPGGVVVEDTVVRFGSCLVATSVDPITDELTEHTLGCGGNGDNMIVAQCWGAQGKRMAAVLKPATPMPLPNGYQPFLYYRADRDEPRDDSGLNRWIVARGSVGTSDAPTVERLLDSLATAADEFTFQIGTGWPRSGSYSHTVDLSETDTAAAVADLRLRCAGSWK